MKTYNLNDRRCQLYLSRVERRRDLLLSDARFARASRIISEIRKRGDQALLKHIRLADLKDFDAGEIRLAGRPADAADEISEDLRWAIDAAVDTVRRVHRDQVLDDASQETNGTVVATRLRPVASVGVVLPSHHQADLGNLLAAVVPARAAGVTRVAVAVPPRSYLGHATVRYLLDRLQVDDVYLMGGVHAVAALAFGTESVAAVDCVVGNGDADILAAKHLVAAHVPVDPRGGPPEIAIVADGTAQSQLVAADLLGELERSADAVGLVVTTDARLAHRVTSLVRSRTRKLPRSHPAREALRRWSAVVVTDTEHEACAVVNRLRLARVELLTVEPQRLAERLDCAAVVSLGPWSPLALAEAVAGACALVPSLGVAGAHGALTAHSFCRASYEISVAAEHYPRLAAAAGLLAEAQGLPLRGAALVDGARGER